MVMEEMEQNWDDMGAAMDAGSMEAEAAPSFWGKYKFLVIAGVAAAAGIAAAVVIRIRKKRKAAREEEDVYKRQCISSPLNSTTQDMVRPLHGSCWL